MKKNTLLIFLLVSFLNAYSQICNSVTNGAFSTNSSGWTITPGTGTWVRSGSFGGIILVTTDNSTQSLSQSINGLSNTPVSNQVDLYFDLYASNNGGTTGASVSDLSVSLNGTIYAIFSNPTGTASITVTSQNGSSISNFSTGVTPTGLTLISRQIKISIPYTGPNSATLEFLHNSPTSGTDNWGLDNIKIDTVCAAVCPYALPVSSAAAFQCPLNLVEVVGKRPVTKGYLYNQLWYGTDDIGDSSENAPPAIQSSWSSAFRITDAFGLPAHPFSPTDSGILVDPNLGFKDNSTLLNPFPGSPTNFVGRENGQQDGWLMIPPGLTCIGFRIGGSNNLFRESSALYAGRDLSNLTFVGEKHYANSSNFLDTTYILPTNLMTIGNCGWKVLRIRFYHHDPKITSNSNVLWNIGDGFVVIPYEYMQPVSNPLLDDNIPTLMQYSRSRLAYQDAKGDVYARNTNSSVGSAFALDPRFCESINVLETNVRANGNCNPVFSCGITPVKVEGYSSASTTPYFLNRCWYNTDDIGSDIQWFAPPQLGTDSGSFYGPIDIFGLPTFGTSTSPTNANNTAIQTIGVDDGGSSLLPINSGVTGRENVQQDGWLAVPNYINCINFRKPASNANSSGFYIIEQDSTPVLVFNNHSMPSGVTSVTSIGSYCLKGDEPLVGSGFKLLRVRYYHHDADAQSSSVVQWDIGSSYQTVPSANLYPAASPTSMSLPTFSETNSIIRYGLLDENSTIWQANGSSKPTTVIDLTTTANLALNFKITELDNCTGQPAPTTGPTCAATISADPCEVEVDLIDPCQCDKPGNIYANPANYRSVTLFKETAVVTSGTLTGFTIDSAYGIYDNTGAPIAMPLSPTSSIVDDGITTATFDFYSKPDENYEIFVADGTGTIVANLAGLCSEPNGCNCQEKPEVCGDNIDNDFDGLIDVADSDVTGNCTKNCPLTAVKVRGKAPVGDGRVTTQVWSQFTTPPYTLNYPATRNSSPVSSISGLKFPFSNTDVNGLPLHVNGAAGTITSGPLTGQSATHTNFSFFGLRDGTPLTRAYGLGGTKSEQVQMDAWIIVPPNATCFELRINNPIRLDATALYLGSSVTDLELIGESYSVGSPKTNMGDYRAPSGSETDINYEYNVNSDPNNALTSLGCGYRLLRARIYCYDAHQFIDARMMWNIGFGWQVIPTEYIQSVGTTAASTHTDGNKPSTLKDLNTKCVYRDADGDLFDANGNFYALDQTICEEIIVGASCVYCPPQNIACSIVDTVPTQYRPVCGVQPYQITKREYNDTTGNLFTQYWETDSAIAATANDVNLPYQYGFPVLNNSGTCPNCLPAHPRNANASLYLPTLGLTSDANITDVDGNGFRPIKQGVGSREQAQQDGWLLVPGHVNKIQFKLGGGVRWDASALYLGTHIDSMSYVGENYNRSGRNPFSYVTYNLPTTCRTTGGCSQPFKILRIRFYHHDNGTRSNTEILWNIGEGYQRIPRKYLRSVSSACANTYPSILNSFTTGSTRTAIQDTNGVWFAYSNPGYPAIDNNSINDSIAFVTTLYDTIKVTGCDVITPICGTPADVSNMCYFCNQLAVLPINFISLKAGCENNKIQVKWIVEIKSQVKNYTVLRSIDNGKTWVLVNTIPVINNQINAFEYVENSDISSQLILYKIIENKFDGTFIESDVIRVLTCNNNNKNQIVISPNPTNSLVNINLANFTNVLNVKLYDAQGKLLVNYNIHDTNASVLNLENYSEGVFYLYISSEYGTLLEKIIKIK